MVLDVGFEPTTPTMSMWCSTPELAERRAQTRRREGLWQLEIAFFVGGRFLAGVACLNEFIELLLEALGNFRVVLDYVLALTWVLRKVEKLEERRLVVGEGFFDNRVASLFFVMFNELPIS